MHRTLQHILLDHYRRHPDRLYVRCLAPGREPVDVTYGVLVERGSRFARAMRQAGAGQAATTIIILPHSVDLYCAFFGAILGSCIPSILAVPSFKLNLHHYRSELEALLDRIDAAAIVTDAATATHLGVERENVGRARLLIAEDVPPTSCDVPAPAASPDDILLLQHSSGSTGLKKGVALSHRAVLNQIAAYAAEIDLQDDDRIASWLPLYHDMGLIACAVMPAVLGIPVTALSPFHWVTSPASLLHAIHQDRCTLTWLPNFSFEFLAARVRNSQLQGLRLDSMRAWINCSEPTIAASHCRFLARFAPYGVRPETLWTCYAAAETTFAITQSSTTVPARVDRIEREAFLTRGEARPATVPGTPALELLSGGRPLANTEIRILDDAGNDMPERHVGEIAIRSTSLFSGYFRDAASTAAALRDGWYLSGDFGYRADDHVVITGRKKDIIIIAGKNYYPQDIERIVSEVPGIYPGRVVALGVDDPALGTQMLVVLAEVSDPRLVDDPGLVGRVRQTLSEHLDCVIEDLRLLPHMWLLKTSSGKIARHPNLARYLDELAGPRMRRAAP